MWSCIRCKRKPKIRTIPIPLQRSDEGSASTSTKSIVCRICLDESKSEKLITPCKCKGTIGLVHQSCLEHWLSVSNLRSCELCAYTFVTTRRPKYPCLFSIVYWIFVDKDPMYHRGLKGDLIVCILLTPFFLFGIYGCILAADYYAAQLKKHVPVAKWTTISLLIMIILLTFAYYLWLAGTVKFHGKIWYIWWQNTNIVHIKKIECSSQQFRSSDNLSEAQVQQSLNTVQSISEDIPREEITTMVRGVIQEAVDYSTIESTEETKPNT